MVEFHVQLIIKKVQVPYFYCKSIKASAHREMHIAHAQK